MPTRLLAEELASAPAVDGMTGTHTAAIMPQNGGITRDRLSVIMAQSDLNFIAICDKICDNKTTIKATNKNNQSYN
jgi:hypothetical protein